METRLLIGGEQVAGDGPGLDVENPFTQATLATVTLPSPAQVDAAIAAAREAARGWADTPAVERCELLHEVATRLRAGTDALAELMTREGGKPLVENADDVGWTAAAFDYYAEMGRNFAGRVIPTIESTQLALVLKEPLGVVAAIVPWNYPLALLAWKLAPALAAGNTVVCKPSELTPLSTLALAPCLDHLPPGVVGLLAGAGDVGEALVGGRRARGRRGLHGLGGDRQADRGALRRARGAHQPRDGRQGPRHRADGVRAAAREGRRPGRCGGRGGGAVADRRRRRRAGVRAPLRARGRHRGAGADRPAARGDVRPGGADRAGVLTRRGDRACQLDALRARRHVYTRDLETVVRCMREIKAGTVWFNDPLTDNDAGPFGGSSSRGWAASSVRRASRPSRRPSTSTSRPRSRPSRGGIPSAATRVAAA